MNTKNITLSTNERIGLVSNLRTMLAAGISIIETIDSLLQDSKGNQKKILETLKEDLNQGQRINTSFAKFPQVFDSITVNIIKASEEAGTLDVTLKDIAERMQKDSEFSDKLRGAMIYPAFIMLVFVGVLFMILVVVVPKISTVFLRLRVPLPLPTRVMIFASDLILHNTLYFLGGFTLFFGLFFLLYKKNKQLIFSVLFSLPVISGLIKQIDLTRFSRSLHLLLAAGLPITTALELTEKVVLRKDIRDVIHSSREMVIAGKNLSEGFKARKDVLPGMVIRMVEAGEKSGSLDKSMQDITTYFEYQVTNNLETVTALLEPIMLLFVGVGVGGMMLSIISPIYGLISQIGH